MTLPICIGGIVLFIGLGIAVISGVLDHRYFGGAPVEQSLVLALIFNAILVIFGWRRHRAVEIEMHGRSAAEDCCRA